MNAENRSRTAHSRGADPAGSVPVPQSRRLLREGTGARRAEQPALAVVNGVLGAGATALPSPEQLLAGISGHLDTDGAPALVGFAHELGGLRAALPAHPLDPAPHSVSFAEADLRRRITAVVEQIDTWRLRHLPHRTGARTHTHSLGQVIDQVATRYVDARWAVLHCGDRRLRRTAWFHLGQAREGYADLVADIRAGRIELPVGWRGFRAAVPTRSA
ncbi:hypothetical protein [Nocardia sienata]|uniref:hypothetical protein n=1 Tax=Nocardia sienata TaxID=248552 RepID=UPI000AEEA007|nr:hypothetical protein [Nocardia sienata]